MRQPQGSQHTVTFLPWLNLSQAIGIDDFVFWRFPADKDQFDAGARFDAQLRRIFTSYVDVEGNPTRELTIASFRSDPFRDLSNDEAQGINELVRFLAFAVMAENDYYLQPGQYFNSTHFQHFHQRFQLGSTWIAPETRHRHGRTLHGGFRHGQLRFTMPLHVVTTLRASPNIPLFQALAKLIDQDTSDAAAIRQVVDWFFLANSDSDSVSPRTEIVMMGSAFEALLQVHDKTGKKDALMEGLSPLFAHRLSNVAEREGTDRVRTTRSWKAWWMDEFYWLRNKIVHGGKIAIERMTWTFHEHLTIAAILLTIGVKLKLSQAGCYTLTSDDETNADSVDLFIAEGNLSQEKLLEARQNARWDRISEKVLQRLQSNNSIDEAPDRGQSSPDQEVP